MSVFIQAELSSTSPLRMSAALPLHEWWQKGSCIDASREERWCVSPWTSNLPQQACSLRGIWIHSCCTSSCLLVILLVPSSEELLSPQGSVLLLSMIVSCWLVLTVSNHLLKIIFRKWLCPCGIGEAAEWVCSIGNLMYVFTPQQILTIFAGCSMIRYGSLYDQAVTWILRARNQTAASLPQEMSLPLIRCHLASFSGGSIWKHKRLLGEQLGKILGWSCCRLTTVRTSVCTHLSSPP